MPSATIILRSTRAKSLARVLVVKPSCRRTLSVASSQRKLHFTSQTRANIYPNQSEILKAAAARFSSANKLTPTTITAEEYHKLTDVFFEKLVTLLEEVSDKSKDMDVEYSNGMLEVVHPPRGTYVINKQTPSRQIWLSSPVSGPKRFDFVGGSTWVYMKDGTVLRDLLLKELGVDMDVELEDDR